MEQLFFNKYPIKKPSSLIYSLKKIGDNSINVYGDITCLYDVLSITDKNVNLTELIEVIDKNRNQIRTIISYVKNNANYVDISRLNEYLEYRKINPFTSNSEIALKLMYGNEIGCEMFKQQQSKFSKYYTTEYYLNLGMSYDESLKLINEYKSKKSTKLENFIKKYGKTIGVEKYNTYVNKSKNTIETFKERYGDNWEMKWSKYIKKDSSSFNYALKKANGDVEKAKIIFNDKIKKTTITLDFLIKKYGEIDGKQKWVVINKLKDSSSLDFFINKYGDNQIARDNYFKSNKQKDSSSLQFFINKYGDNGYVKYLEKCKNSDSNSFNFYLKKYGEHRIANEKYIEGQIKRKVKILRASRSSLFYFQPLYDFLINNGLFNKNEIYLGIDGSNEYFLKNSDVLFFYDFTIPSKKIIIEFNGSAWHPNWEKYGLIECEKHFKNKNIDVSLAVKKDITKLNIAKENGYDVLILWEDDGVVKNKEKLYNYLIKKGIEYEN